MRNCTTFLPILMSILFNVKCTPISQPGYESPQYVGSQNIPTVSYKPQQIQYKPVQPQRPAVQPKAAGLQYYATQQQQQHQQQQQKSPPAINTAGYGPVRQVFVPTSQGPREIDANYYDQVVKAQQQTYRAQQPQAQQASYQPQQIKYVPQPQQVKYVAQPQGQYNARYQQQQPQAPLKKEEDEEEQEGDYDPNPSYQFGFDVKDDQFTNYQTRKEERDGKVITGSYSVVDADGYIRTVKYTAHPKDGFKAEVSREPTDIKIKIPKPEPQYQQLPRQHPEQLAARAQQHQPQYIQVGAQRVAHRPQPQENENVVYQYQ
ncbi:uncharacterized protein LOC126739612 [Anthonomus grandis grandis]|uniref:uncharacterized protein LOC126739612 n=1 Tax=Anthonomus grandis grandis TaxID=2921223 RepID=UPI002165ED88|nr:uncharacterized protein LOC126739612 [Anthonomus grandis grandis]